MSSYTYKTRDMAVIQSNIRDIIGSRVRLVTNLGKQKPITNFGVVLGVYPNIFTVQLFDGALPSRKISYSYADVLTNSVDITLC